MVRTSATFATVLSVSGMAWVAGSALATQIEVNVDGGFIPLEKALVPTCNASVRIIREPDIPVSFSVLLTRSDDRAGIGGAGKAITVGASGSGAVLQETGPGTGIYVGVVRVLIGVNTLRIQPVGGGPDFLSATMLNYTLQFEDVNGNSLLDTGEDANHNGLLEDGEDVNGNKALDLTEDFNGNRLLDVGEDLNGNLLLDYNEDQNGNGQLNTTEDLNNSGILDTGEDRNANGLIDPLSFGTGGDFPSGAGDFATIAGTSLTYSLRAIELDMVNNATDSAISAFLQKQLLAPLGVLIDDSVTTKSKLVTVTVPIGSEALELVKTLNGLPVNEFNFYPTATPVDPPLEVALAVLTEQPPVTVGEAMPARLRNGAAAPPSAGNAGDAYNANNGGFDNDNDGGANDFDETNIFANHFLMQTFAAHRLVDHLVAGVVGNPNRPVVALIDTGLGMGAPLMDIPGARIVRPTDCTAAGACGVVAGIAAIPDAWTAGAAMGNHGTGVAVLAAGAGSRILGTGKDVAIRPIKAAGPMNTGRYAQGLVTAAADAAVRVIVLEFQQSDYDANNNGTIDNAGAGAANEMLAAVTALNTARANWLPGINAVLVANPTIIMVIPAGNAGHDTSFSILAPAMAAIPAAPPLPAIPAMGGLFNAPARTVRNAANINALVMGIGNTSVEAPPLGRELLAASPNPLSSSNFGSRISVAAPSDSAPSLAPNQNFQSFGGTSGAAPQAAGLAGELIFLDSNSAAVGPFTALQIVELIEATGDDLGSTTAHPGPFINEDAGNGPDDRFGFGRLNAWKAVLSAVSGGIAFQHGRTTNILGNDSHFRSLRHIYDVDTLWYGFEIVTAERAATVWIDGAQLMDAGATIPNAPNITAYKGVRSHQRMERGVHEVWDGSGFDPVAGVRPGNVVEEDPLVGIVPVGTRVNDRGQYVMTFSIQRSDLYNGGAPRTLSLRRRGQGVADKPLFNLLLDTAKMKTGEVSGVTFDDFVFQIVPPDYGDAKIAPTLMNAENGARHHNSTMEWLGKLNGQNRQSVTPEHNANREPLFGGDSRVDVDGVENRRPVGGAVEFHDRDGRDDGVLFFPLTYRPAPGLPGKVQFTLGVFDRANPRYAADVDHCLYVNLWIDWNCNGVWNEGNSEHVLDGVRINPGGPWTITNPVAPRTVSSTTQILSGADLTIDTATFESMIPVGTIGKGPMWARIRLDYGEDVGRNDPLPNFESLPSLRPVVVGTRGLVAGTARYGEVEDYLIGSDFGDAPDPFTGPGMYPTLKVSMGARHLDVHQEWLGPDNNVRPNPTRETDADDTVADEDNMMNLVNKDVACDGVSIPPTIPGTFVDIEVTVTSSISARGAAGAGAAMPATVSIPEDDADTLPRYRASDPKRRLYLSGWADWNGDGVWATPGEKIIDDILDPATFGADGSYNLGEAYTDLNMDGVCVAPDPFTDAFGIDTKMFVYTVFVPFNVAEEFWYRFRLAFGENETTVDLMTKENDETGRANIEEKGGALFGEVEDYPGERKKPAIPVEVGVDLWTTVPGVTYQDFTGTPIPADFFDPGSDPFTGTVSFQGVPINLFSPLGLTDTIVERLARAEMPACGSDWPYDVPITVRALSLQSVSPLTISYFSGAFTESWNLDVRLSQMPQPVGSMTIRQQSMDGGSYESSLPVLPRLIFTRVGDNAQRVLDTGMAGMPAIEFTGDSGWVYSPNPVFQVNSVPPGMTFDYTGAGDLTTLVVGTSNFTPGINPLGGSCNLPGEQVKRLSPEEAMWAAHGVLPAQEPQADFCPNSHPITDGVFTFDTQGATTDGPPSCGQIGADIWFQYHATCDGVAGFNTCGSSYDTVIVVYNDPTCPPANSAEIGCNDDACGLQSTVNVPVTAGSVYLVRIGGFQGATGEGALTVSCEAIGRCCFGIGTPAAGCAENVLQSTCQVSPPPASFEAGGACGGDATCVLQPSLNPAIDGGIYSDQGCDVCGNPQLIADDFRMLSPTNVLSVQWHGFYNPGPDLPPDLEQFTLKIWINGPDQLPQLPIYQDTFTPIFNNPNGRMPDTLGTFQYQYLFPGPLHLPPGNYSLEISQNTVGIPADWLWNFGSVDAAHGMPGLSFSLTFPEKWLPAPGDNLAFALICEGSGPDTCASSGCVSSADCDDLALCTLDECQGVCQSQPLLFADVNSDTFINVSDTLCLLDSFAGNPNSPACNGASTDAMDIEPCPDVDDPNNMGNGFVNVGDVLTTLDVFAGLETACAICQGSPNPAASRTDRLVAVARLPLPTATDQAHVLITLEPSTPTVAPGRTVTVDAFLSGPVADLRAYQIGIGVEDGRQRVAAVTRALIDTGRKDYVFAGRETFAAVGEKQDRVQSALAAGGASVAERAYLATFTLTIPPDAAKAWTLRPLLDPDTLLYNSRTERLLFEVRETTLPVVSVKEERVRAAK